MGDDTTLSRQELIAEYRAKWTHISQVAGEAVLREGLIYRPRGILEKEMKIKATGIVRRILMDDLFCQPWETRVQAPAYLHLSADQLKDLIRRAYWLLENPEGNFNMLRSESETCREMEKRKDPNHDPPIWPE